MIDPEPLSYASPGPPRPRRQKPGTWDGWISVGLAASTVSAHIAVHLTSPADVGLLPCTTLVASFVGLLFGNWGRIASRGRSNVSWAGLVLNAAILVYHLASGI